MNVVKQMLIKFISMLKKLFTSKNKKETIIIDYDATPEEKWICNSFVQPFSNARFEEEDGDGYRAFFDKETYSFVLELERKNLYAWVQNKFYRYKDFRGILNNKTRDAIRRYQKEHGLIPDGYPSNETYLHILDKGTIK